MRRRMPSSYTTGSIFYVSTVAFIRLEFVAEALTPR
jgi:hypothetical protein